MDRVIASRLGVAAVEGLLDGKNKSMAGLINNKIVFTPFIKTIKHHKELNKNLLRIVEILSM